MRGPLFQTEVYDPHALKKNFKESTKDIRFDEFLQPKPEYNDYVKSRRLGMDLDMPLKIEDQNLEKKVSQNEIAQPTECLTKGHCGTPPEIKKIEIENHKS